MEEEQKKPMASKFDWAKPKEVTPEIYGNYIHTSWTLFDVRFQIGQLVPSGANPSAGFVSEQRGAVTIAWPQAKALRDVLVDLVARYEKVNGEIKTPVLAPNS
jgi:hypothetical protein